MGRHGTGIANVGRKVESPKPTPSAAMIRLRLERPIGTMICREVRIILLVRLASVSSPRLATRAIQSIAAMDKSPWAPLRHQAASAC